MFSVLSNVLHGHVDSRRKSMGKLQTRCSEAANNIRFIPSLHSVHETNAPSNHSLIHTKTSHPSTTLTSVIRQFYTQSTGPIITTNLYIR